MPFHRQIISLALLAMALAPAGNVCASWVRPATRDIRAVVNAGLPAGNVAVYATYVDSTQPLVNINGDVLMPPASCTKLLTAAAALKELGVDYRFRTQFLSDATPRDGMIGTLYLKGDGDPLLTPEAFWRMAGALRDNGIRRIAGDIVIDTSFFSDDNFPHIDSNEGRAFEAPTGAFSANFNVVEFAIAPGDRPGAPASVVASPAAPYVVIENRVRTGGATRVGVSTRTEADHEVFTVSGEVTVGSGVSTLAKSVRRPLMYAGSMFAELARQHGVVFGGTIREGAIPSSARALFDAPSPPLATMVREMDKWSSNFIAEQIIKHLGKLRSDRPGSTAQGLVVIRDWLESIGIPRGTYELENGSGLSNHTRLTARQLVTILNAAHNDQAIGPDLMSSLSILGVDGTMQHWIGATELRGLLRAKTGTLKGVTALAGYVPDAHGRLIAFAIMGQHVSIGINEAREGELKIVQAIANSR